MHNIYATEGLVIKTKNSGEADKILSVFTKDFGRLEIFARGARNGKSKLNCHLGIYDHARFCFVAGKERWRLTDAEKINSWDFIFRDRRKTKQISEITDILEKLVSGQEKNEELWQAFLNIFIFLNAPREQAKEDEAALKKAAVLKILYFLGYADSDLPCVNGVINNPCFDEKTLELFKKNKENFKAAETAIKEALKQSSLA